MNARATVTELQFSSAGNVDRRKTVPRSMRSIPRPAKSSPACLGVVPLMLKSAVDAAHAAFPAWRAAAPTERAALLFRARRRTSEAAAKSWREPILKTTEVLTETFFETSTSGLPGSDTTPVWRLKREARRFRPAMVGSTTRCANRSALSVASCPSIILFCLRR